MVSKPVAYVTARAIKSPTSSVQPQDGKLWFDGETSGIWGHHHSVWGDKCHFGSCFRHWQRKGEWTNPTAFKALGFRRNGLPARSKERC